MFKWIDRSPFLLKMLERISTQLARKRGLPIIIGIGVFLVGFILNLINSFADTQALEFFGVLFRDGGILIALIGVLLAEPLGR